MNGSSSIAKTIALLLMTILSFSLLMTRIIITGQFTFLFLAWNLFLAFIPMGISSLLFLKRDKNEKSGFWITAIVWLIFFPNAPYILTDLFHLMPRNGVQPWFDLMLILSFALAGLMLSLMSLRQMESMVMSYHGKPASFFFTSGAILAGSLGVYIGRFERYNSWDLFRNPVEISRAILPKIIYPMHDPRLWAWTLIMGSVLGILYLFHRNSEKQEAFAEFGQDKKTWKEKSGK